MTATLILQYVLALLQAAPAVLQAGTTVEAWFANTQNDLKAMQAAGVDPTPAQWAALNAQLLAALAALQAAKPSV